MERSATVAIDSAVTMEGPEREQAGDTDIDTGITTDAVGARPAVGTAAVLRRRSWWPSDATRRNIAAITAIVISAGALRFINIKTAYDLFVDEFFYDAVAHSGSVPQHMPAGWGASTSDVFVLHPPGFFVLLGTWHRILGLNTDIFDQVFQARALNALLGALTAGLLYVLGRRISGRGAGMAAALLFALDPFILRQNGRVLLETATLFWTVAGYVVVIGLAKGYYRRPRAAAVSAGVLFGCAVLTKDVAALETVAVLLVLALFKWGIDRRWALISAAVSIAMYLAYIVCCVVQGYGGVLWTAKTYGVDRVMGVVQITGFNRPGSVSLSGTLLSQVGAFAPTYLVVALGAASSVWLVRSRRPDHRIIAGFMIAATVYLGYSVLFGTIEEQFLYFMIIPAIISVVVVGGEMWRRATVAMGAHRRIRLPKVGIALITAVALLCAWDSVTWAKIRFTPDNATESAVDWLLGNAKDMGPIAVTTGSQLRALTGSGMQAISLHTPREMAADHVRFVILSTRNTILNYSYVRPEDAQWYRDHGHAVFAFQSATQGMLAIYETNDPLLW